MSNGSKALASRPRCSNSATITGHEVEFTAPYASGKLRRTKPLALDEYQFLAGITALTGKITLPAPSTMHFYRATDFADKSAYADAKASSPI